MADSPNGSPQLPQAIAELLEPIARRRAELEAQREEVMRQLEPITAELKQLARIESAANPVPKPGPKKAAKTSSASPEIVQTIATAAREFTQNGSPTFTVPDLTKATGLSDNTVRGALAQMRSDETVRMVGKVKGGRGHRPMGYRLVETV